MATMLPVSITVALNGREVSVENLADARVASALRNAGQDVARRLATIHCPVHRTAATNVRVHFDARGRADLKYESCCEALGRRIGEALG